MKPLLPAELNAYHMLHTAAAWRDETSHARLWLAGDDRIAFLQRLTTNDMRLQPGEGTLTLLTTPTARIQAALTALALPDGLLLLAGAGQGPAVFNALRTQIFFNDQVTLEGRGAALCQFNLLGPQAAATLAALAGDRGWDDLPLWAWRRTALDGIETTVQRNEGLGHSGFTLLAAAEDAAAVRAALLQAGAAALPEAAYETARIEQGIPAPGSELNDHVTPLEAGLQRFCNERKGCYTGQEIIARQITYDKVTTHLVGLWLDRPVSPPAALLADGRPAGSITSSVHSVAWDTPIALAYVRRPFHDPGSTLAVQAADAVAAARVASLPFAR